MKDLPEPSFLIHKAFLSQNSCRKERDWNYCDIQQIWFRYTVYTDDAKKADAKAGLTKGIYIVGKQKIIVK